MIVRITCMCGEVTELAEPQAQRLKSCPACGAPLQKSAAQHEKAEIFFDSPLYSCPTSLLTAWHFIVGIGLLKAAALLLTVFTPAIEIVHPMVITAGLLAASAAWLATGFAFLAHLKWAIPFAKGLNAAGALIAILVIAVWCAQLIIAGPSALIDMQTWLSVGPMLIIGPVCLWVILRLEQASRPEVTMSLSLQKIINNQSTVIA